MLFQSTSIIFLIQIRAIYPDDSSKVIAAKLSKCDCDRANCPCDDLHPTTATFAFLHSPSAVAVDANGVVYIADKVKISLQIKILVFLLFWRRLVMEIAVMLQ